VSSASLSHTLDPFNSEGRQRLHRTESAFFPPPLLKHFLRLRCHQPLARVHSKLSNNINVEARPPTPHLHYKGRAFFPSSPPLALSEVPSAALFRTLEPINNEGRQCLHRTERAFFPSSPPLALSEAEVPSAARSLTYTGSYRQYQCRGPQHRHYKGSAFFPPPLPSPSTFGTEVRFRASSRSLTYTVT